MEAYAGYCTGKLKKPMGYRRATGTGNWQGSGEVTPAGTELLLDAKNARYGGFVLLPDGVWASLAPEGEADLVKDVDFESDCAPATLPASDDARVRVAVGRATVYKEENLSGTPCVVAPATVIGMFQTYDWLGSDKPVRVGSKKLTALCGFEKGYTRDMHVGELLPRAAPAAK